MVKLLALGLGTVGNPQICLFTTNTPPLFDSDTHLPLTSIPFFPYLYLTPRAVSLMLRSPSTNVTRNVARRE